MIKVHSFIFNSFLENTYILYDETKECIIIDPGCCEINENRTLSAFIEKQGLKPVRLINTHCHIDHILGNDFVCDKYGLLPEYHKGEIPLVEAAPKIADMYGMNYSPFPAAEKYLDEGNVIHFGNTSLEILFTPGHSPASLCFYSSSAGILIAGDVLFYGSIGRTDLPGGDYDTLIRSINEKLMILPDETIVFPGHGERTTIGYERKSNPFLQ